MKFIKRIFCKHENIQDDVYENPSIEGDYELEKDMIEITHYTKVCAYALAKHSKYWITKSCKDCGKYLSTFVHRIKSKENQAS